MEVGLEEPLARIDRLRPADVPEFVRPAVGHEQVNVGDHAEHVIRIRPLACRAVSSSTVNGIAGWRAKYQASRGTSYSATAAPPAFIVHGSAVVLTTRSRNEYGGAGRRAMKRSRSNGR